MMKFASFGLLSKRCRKSDLMTKPNHYDCEECEHWDPVNGCWNNETNIWSCQMWIEIHDPT